jgi:hypothetical protein
MYRKRRSALESQPSFRRENVTILGKSKMGRGAEKNPSSLSVTRTVPTMPIFFEDERTLGDPSEELLGLGFLNG